MLTYAQWVDARAAEVASEGVVGGGQGQGWWPSAKRGETVEEIGQDAAIAGGRGTDAQATENAAPRPRVEEELVAGPEAEARIKELRTRHGRAVRVRWGRRWTAEEGRGVVSYPDEEGLTT
jgi:hypothetical protein